MYQTLRNTGFDHPELIIFYILHLNQTSIFKDKDFVLLSYATPVPAGQSLGERS